MCLAENSKWETFHINHFYDTCLSSCTNIYNSFTSIEIDHILNFLQSLKPHALKMPKCVGKVQKANSLGFLLGHEDPVILKAAKIKQLTTLRTLCWTIVKNEVPALVLKVSCASWFFDIMFP